MLVCNGLVSLFVQLDSLNRLCLNSIDLTRLKSQEMDMQATTIGMQSEWPTNYLVLSLGNCFSLLGIN